MSVGFYYRYFLEHKLLPNALYNEGSRLLSIFMINRGQAVCDFYQKVTSITPSYSIPYDRDDCTIDFRTYIRDSESCIVLRIEMPEPEKPLLCRAVYLCYGTRSGYELYITSELSEDGSYLVCGWTDNGRHLNFGNAPDDPSDEMDLAAELFWQSIENRKTA